MFLVSCIYAGYNLNYASLCTIFEHQKLCLEVREILGVEKTIVNKDFVIYAVENFK